MNGDADTIRRDWVVCDRCGHVWDDETRKDDREWQRPCACIHLHGQRSVYRFSNPLAAENERLREALRTLETELRSNVAECLCGGEGFCDAYGCDSITKIADRIAALAAVPEERPPDA